jgi:hypothetical protein
VEKPPGPSVEKPPEPGTEKPPKSHAKRRRARPARNSHES